MLSTSVFSTIVNNFVFFVLDFRLDSQQNEVGTGFWIDFAVKSHLYVEYGFVSNIRSSQRKCSIKKVFLKIS